MASFGADIAGSTLFAFFHQKSGSLWYFLQSFFSVMLTGIQREKEVLSTDQLEKTPEKKVPTDKGDASSGRDKIVSGKFQTELWILFSELLPNQMARRLMNVPRNILQYN